jgi:hypothetical protein
LGMVTPRNAKVRNAVFRQARPGLRVRHLCGGRAQGFRERRTPTIGNIVLRGRCHWKQCAARFAGAKVLDRMCQPARNLKIPYQNQWDGGAGGIRTLDTPLQAYNGLANRRLQPLGHSSVGARRIESGLSGQTTNWHPADANSPLWMRPLSVAAAQPFSPAQTCICRAEKALGHARRPYHAGRGDCQR